MRGERAKKKLEKAYSFMIRLRIPGGVTTPKQWLALDAIAGTYANGTLRLTTRADVPVPRRHQVEPEAHDAGDQRRAARHARRLRRRQSQRDGGRQPVSVEGASPRPTSSREAISEHLLPQTGAYHEIWLDGEKVDGRKRPGEEGRGADLRRALPAAQIQDRHRRAAGQRRRHLRARPRLHRHRREGQARRLERDRRRRHGHDARRDRHLPAHGRPARLLHARAGRSTSPRRSSPCSATGATARAASARA